MTVRGRGHQQPALGNQLVMPGREGRPQRAGEHVGGGRRAVLVFADQLRPRAAAGPPSPAAEFALYQLDDQGSAIGTDSSRSFDAVLYEAARADADFRCRDLSEVATLLLAGT